MECADNGMCERRHESNIVMEYGGDDDDERRRRRRRNTGQRPANLWEGASGQAWPSGKIPSRMRPNPEKHNLVLYTRII